MNKEKIFFDKLIINIQKEIILEKPRHSTLEKHLIDTNESMKDKYTIIELREIKNNLSKHVKELTTLRDEYLPVGVVILSEYEEFPETCMFFN